MLNGSISTTKTAINEQFIISFTEIAERTNAVSFHNRDQRYNISGGRWARLLYLKIILYELSIIDDDKGNSTYGCGSGLNGGSLRVDRNSPSDKYSNKDSTGYLLPIEDGDYYWCREEN